MTAGTILLSLLIFLTGLLILVIKSWEVWRGLLQTLPQWQRLVVVVVMVMGVATGGSKVGPTKANLKLLLAERSGKLSNGVAFGRKSGLMVAAENAEAAGAAAVTAADIITNATASVELSATNVNAVAESTRYYVRLTSPSPVVTNFTVYAEITVLSVSNGVATAGVWFNVVPNNSPVMQFNFASERAPNCWFTARATDSSYPDTVACGGYDCYLYYFAVPAVLLNDNGGLIAPLQWEKRVAFGAPETGDAMDIKGGLAIYADGNFYVAVTGWRTNSAGTAMYFDNGRLANPPAQAMETPGGPENE